MFKRLVILLAAVFPQLSPAAAVAEPALRTGDERNASFSWRGGERSLRVSASGRLAFGDATRKEPQQLMLPIRNQEWITRLSVLTIGDDVLIAADTEAGDTGRGLLCRLAARPAGLRWCTALPGFNVFAATGREGAIFVGAIGFVGRVDPGTGKLLWQQSGLYARDKAFNIFCALADGEDTVSLQATSGTSGHTKRIVLDRRSGTIIAIEEAAGACR